MTTRKTPTTFLPVTFFVSILLVLAGWQWTQATNFGHQRIFQHNQQTNQQTGMPGYVFDLPSSPDYNILPLLTVGDEAPKLEGTFGNFTPSATTTYAMAGIPDGLGIYDTGSGYYIYVNHEINSNQTSQFSSTDPGIIKGARVSLFEFNYDWQVVGGRNLIGTVELDGDIYALNPNTGNYVDGSGNILNDFTNDPNLARFCSGYLATEGFEGGPIWFAPEEIGGRGGVGYAIYPNGHAFGILGLGKYAKEQVYAASQHRADDSDMTILFSTEDDSDGEVYMFIGSQTPSDPNGFASGQLYVMRVEGYSYETIPQNTPQVATWSAVPDNIALGTRIELRNFVNQSGVSTNFRRLEDFHEDPNHPGTFYFVTTGSGDIPPGMTEPDNTLGKLYRFTLNPDDPTAPMTFEYLLEGGETTGVSYDNITVDSNGLVVIQEDRAAGGGAIMDEQMRYSRVLAYDIATQDTFFLLEANQEEIDPSSAGEYGDWETSGIIEIDANPALGLSSYLLSVQAHSISDPDYVQGGQVLMAVPASWSDAAPYIFFPEEKHARIATPLLTVKQEVPLLDGEFGSFTPLTSTFALAGIPDGLGLYDNGSGYTLYLNHNLSSSDSTQLSSTFPGIINGARVSLFEFTYDWEPVGGRNLIDVVHLEGITYTLDITSGNYLDVSHNILNAGTGDENLASFASGYLATEGFENGPVWFAPEEVGGRGGIGYAVFPGGDAVALPGLGKYPKEQVFPASQYRADNSDSTILLVTEADSDGELYLYAGNQTPEDPNGFENGTLYVLKVDDYDYETMPSNIPLTAHWTMIPITATYGTAGDLSDWVNLPGNSTNFRNLADIHEDPNNPGTFYFATSGSDLIPPGGDSADNALGKLYRLTLNPAEPAGEPTLELLLEGGDETGVSYDNLTIDQSGLLIIQEDRTAGGGAVMASHMRYAQMIGYDVGAGNVTVLAEANQSLDPTVLTDYGNWETSGVIEVDSNAPGQSSYLLDVQAHSFTSTGYVEGGQIVLISPLPVQYLPIIVK